MNTADVIVICGGMVGLATAHQLACKGVKTILLRAGIDIRTQKKEMSVNGFTE